MEDAVYGDELYNEHMRYTQKTCTNIQQTGNEHIELINDETDIFIDDDHFDENTESVCR